MKELLLYVAKNLVDQPDAVRVTQTESEEGSSWSSTSPPRIWGRSSVGKEESPKKSGPLSKPLPSAAASGSRWTLSINVKEVWTAQ